MNIMSIIYNAFIHDKMVVVIPELYTYILVLYHFEPTIATFVTLVEYIKTHEH